MVFRHRAYTMNEQSHADFHIDLSQLNHHIKNVSTMTTTKDILTVCSQITETLQVSYYFYGLIYQNKNHHMKYKIYSNQNTDWEEEYKHKSYQLIDPRIKKSLQSLTPIYWDIQESYLQSLDRKARTMMQNAYHHGIRSGVLVSLHDFHGATGVFGLGIDASMYNINSQKYLEWVTPYISHLGAFVHQSMIKQHGLKDEPCLKKPLTEREKDCLCWIADGAVASRIASKLYISENTVKFHLKNIKKKLGAKNTAHALSIAIIKGIIRPIVKH